MTEVQRAAYIMALKDLFKEYELLAKYNGGTDYYRYCALDMAIKELEQMPKESRWLHKNDDHNDWLECPFCGYGDEGEVKLDQATHYCPFCGARLFRWEEH